MNTNRSAADFRAEAAQAEADAAESFERCDTDGFLSQWASGITARVAQANAAIAEHGGVWRFWRWVVTDLDGNPLSFRRANTRFGFKLVVETANGEVWIDPHAKRSSTNTRKGVVVTRQTFEAPAHAATWAPPGATGLSGATSVQVRIFPDDRSLTWDGTDGAPLDR